MTRAPAWRVVAMGSLLASCASAQSPPAERGPLFDPLPAPVFEKPLVVAGTFGDHRSNHFHAGLDLATGVVGWTVHAPMDGEIRRLRASGVGYGRSIYLETTDGRLLVFGHLDAFADPLASYVAAVQDSSGDYEQDLWPERGRFRVRPGDVIGWSGRSGTGSPHLHVEVRRGDMALHPLRAGYAMPDMSTPRIERVTLVPLDDSSYVSGAQRPASFALGARDRVAATGWGRLRVVVQVVDMDGGGDWDIGPWRVRATDGDSWVECRFDSVSWATDMAQSDFVYDRGRYTDQGKRSVLLAAPPRFRPCVIRASAPLPAEAGVLRLDTQGEPHDLAVEAEDLAGHVARRTLRLTAARPTSKDYPARVRAARRASRERSRRRHPHTAWLVVHDPARRDSVQLGRLAHVVLPAGALFEAQRIVVERGATERGSGELVPVTPPVEVGTRTTPLREAMVVTLTAPQHLASDGVGLYRDSGDGWEYVSGQQRTGPSVRGATRRMGRFRLFRDATAPRVEPVSPPRRAPAGPYPRWALEARLADGGSGVDARASHFEVDGRRVPSEWDDVRTTLRWRPLRPPSAGTHRAAIVAADRAGNRRRTDTTFVLE